MRTSSYVGFVALGLISCGPPTELEAAESEPPQSFSSVEQGLVTCGTRQDTGYRNGSAFTITVVTADGKPVEQDTANAYAVMQAAAAAAGIDVSVVSGFRTMAEQEYLYGCYTNCNCNNCSLAARPGFSNHQSGHALDLNTSAPGVLNWLNAHGAAFGFSRTVPSEAWHWEWWGGGPGGGPCGGPVTPLPPVFPTTWVLKGDFDGDGLEDVLSLSSTAAGAWDTGMTLERSTGAGFFSQFLAANTPTHMRNGGATSDYRVLVGDFDGDGKADIASLSPNAAGAWDHAIALELSTGTGFNSQFWPSSTPIHMRNGGAGSDYRVLVGDFNGDGKADIATLSRNAGGAWVGGITVEFSTGTGFRSEFFSASTPGHMRNGGVESDYRVLVGDFNGDGKTDIATLSPDAGGAWAGGITVELSTGTGFTSEFLSASTPGHMRNGGATADYRVLVGDFNGDGKTDIATLSPDAGGAWAGGITVELSTGTGFTSEFLSANTPTHIRNGGNERDYRVLVGDFNGDGKTDIATLSPNGGGAWAGGIAVELSTGVGFTSEFPSANTPAHMRNGGSARDYRTLVGRFTCAASWDLATVSPNGGGGWADWLSMELAPGNGLTSVAWVANTPVHMRNGGWGQTPASPQLPSPNTGSPGTGTCLQDAGTVMVTDVGHLNDAGPSTEVGDGGPTQPDPNTVEPALADARPTKLELAPVHGGCSAAPGMLLLGLIAWARRRRRA